jgi:hypothetical protein
MISSDKEIFSFLFSFRPEERKAKMPFNEMKRNEERDLSFRSTERDNRKSESQAALPGDNGTTLLFV